MPTTFNVISLGTQSIIDPTEGNTIAENASALVGRTFGTVDDPLWEQVQTLSPGTTGFTAGTNNAYDQNNSLANENFRIDGGPLRTFDASAVYNATITYTNGTTANITAVIFQDTAGRTYLAPEFEANADQAALQAGAIRSLTLNSLEGNNYSGMTGSRQAGNFAVCFVEGTLIRTPDGARRVETLEQGDMVETLDHGPQPVRWIGGRCVPAIAGMEPVLFEAGSLGKGLPERAMMLSRQHRVLVDNRVAKRMTGTAQVLLPAHRLAGLPGIRQVSGLGFVTYWHFMCDAHEVVFAEGAPAETLLLGAEARKCLTPAAIAEISALFPELVASDDPVPPARPLVKGSRGTQLVQRMVRNGKPALV